MSWIAPNFDDCNYYRLKSINVFGKDWDVKYIDKKPYGKSINDTLILSSGKSVKFIDHSINGINLALTSSNYQLFDYDPRYIPKSIIKMDNSNSYDKVCEAIISKLRR